MFSFLHTNLPKPILLDIGFIAIHWYGFLITLAVLAGFLVARRLFRLYLPLAKGDSSKTGASRRTKGSVTDDTPSQSPPSKGGEGLDHLYNLIFYLIIFGLVGARLYHVLNEIPYYITNPGQIIAIWNGGLAWHGGLLAGIIVIWLYVKKYPNLFHQAVISRNPQGNYKLQITNYHRPAGSRLRDKQIRNSKSKISNKSLDFSISQFLIAADIFAPALALSQAIGRWGNYFNQELYGLPTNLGWGIPISIENRITGFEGFEFFHPTFLYHSLALLLIFILLMFLHKRRLNQESPQSFATGQARIKNQESSYDIQNSKFNILNKPGAIFAIYIILASLTRLLLELIRIDRTPVLLGTRLPILVSGLLIIVAVWLIWYFKRVNKSKDHVSNQ